jgi:heat shock protein HslJ
MCLEEGLARHNGFGFGKLFVLTRYGRGWKRLFSLLKKIESVAGRNVPMKRPLAFLLSAFAAAFAISCGSTHNPVLSNAAASFKKPPSLIGTEWLLTDMPGTTVVLTSKASFSVLENGRAVGNGSCNRFAGSVEINGRKIKFGPMASTRMACGDEALTAQEAQFLKFLSAADRFEMRDPFLLLFAEGYNQPLHFSRIPPNTFE